MKPRLSKIEPERDELTAYDVRLDGELIGTVVKRETRTSAMVPGASYAYGSLVDVVWKQRGAPSYATYRTRGDAVAALVRRHTAGRETGMSDQPVGPQEIAALLDVAISTVHVWRQRDVLPEPAWVISGVPLWRRETIVAWATETGRMER
jgi:hypothetical protein